MAGQNDFKHITVNSAGDDDVVIYVGAPVAPSDADENGADIEVDVAEMTGDNESDRSSISSKATSKSEPDKSDKANIAKGPAGSSYHETTLEDIESSKMPKTQIVVVTLCVIAIVAFILWYVIVP